MCTHNISVLRYTYTYILLEIREKIKDICRYTSLIAGLTQVTRYVVNAMCSITLVVSNI